MKRLVAVSVAVIVIAGAGVVNAQAGCGACSASGSLKPKAPEIKGQTTCPVMGGKINKDLYVDHDGRRIYVCCKGCIAAVKKEPAKYIKVLESKGETVAKLQTTCPVMGGKINKKQYVDAKGKRIYVCCPGCIGKIKAAPEKYIQKLEHDGVILDPVPKATKHKGGHDAHKGHNH